MAAEVELKESIQLKFRERPGDSQQTRYFYEPGALFRAKLYLEGLGREPHWFKITRIKKETEVIAEGGPRGN